MNSYRIKLYHLDGGISFHDEKFIAERYAFMWAYDRVHYLSDIRMADVYKGTKKLATFY